MFANSTDLVIFLSALLKISYMHCCAVLDNALGHTNLKKKVIFHMGQNGVQDAGCGVAGYVRGLGGRYFPLKIAAVSSPVL